MLNTNAANEYKFDRRDITRFQCVLNFYERLWLDAMTDEGISEYNSEWFVDWSKSYKPTKDILANCLEFAGENEDFLEFYAIEVHLSMRKFIDGKKAE